MKRIPYKCRFGHVSIVGYSLLQIKLGIIECPKCLELAGTEIFIKGKGNCGPTIVRRGEKAVRI